MKFKGFLWCISLYDITCLFLFTFLGLVYSEAQAGFQGIDGTSSVAWKDTRVLFDTNDSAQGFVKFRDGFVVDHGWTTSLDITKSIGGVIDTGPGGINVGATGAIRLAGPIVLDPQATIPHGAMLYGDGNTIHFDGPFALPQNKRLRIMSDTVLDGRGNTFTFGHDAQIIIDHGVTVTLKNMTIKNTRNGYFKQIFTPLGPTSEVALQDVELNLCDDVYFKLGKLFIHDDVVVTGTPTFMYRSDKPVYIDKHASFIFDNGSHFNYNPTTDDENLVHMLDDSSSMFFNGSWLESFGTPLRLTTGMLCFDNDVTLSSKIERPIYWIGADTYVLRPINETVLDLKKYVSGIGINAISWHPNGRYLAVGRSSFSGNNQVYVYEFTGSDLLNIGVFTGDNNAFANSVAWSPDGNYLAVGFWEGGISNPAKAVHVYQFTGSSLNSIGAVASSVNDKGAYSVDWSPDGAYLAVGFSEDTGDDEVHVYRFTGSSLDSIGVTASSANGEAARSVDWSPDGGYLAVAFWEDSGDDEVHVYRFAGSSLDSIGAVASSISGEGARSVSWSPDGTYLAVGFTKDTSDNEVQVYRFTGRSLVQTGAVVNDTTGYGIPQLSWSPDGAYLAVGFFWHDGDYHGNVRIYRFSGHALQEVGSIADAGGYFNAVGWSPGGAYFAAGFSSEADRELQVYHFGDDSYLWNSTGFIFGDDTYADGSRDLDVRVLGGAHVDIKAYVEDDSV